MSVTNGPFYGFERELVEPPTGGYSFIEFDDLKPSTRAYMCLTRAGLTHDHAKRMGLTDTLLDLCDSDSMESFERTVAWLAKAAAAYADPSQRSMKEWNEARESMEREGRRWLVADPGEIKGIIYAMDGIGLKPVLAKTAYPVRKWTCGGMGQEFTPCAPGSIVNCIAVEDAEQTGIDRNGIPTYTVAVVYK